MNKEAHKLSLQAEALSVIALVINFIAMLIHIIRADTDHGIRSVCDQLLCNQVKGVRTLQEIKKEHPYKPASFGHSDKKPIQL